MALGRTCLAIASNSYANWFYRMRLSVWTKGASNHWSNWQQLRGGVGVGRLFEKKGHPISFLSHFRARVAGLVTFLENDYLLWMYKLHNAQDCSLVLIWLDHIYWLLERQLSATSFIRPWSCTSSEREQTSLTLLPMDSSSLTHSCHHSW